MRTLRSSSSLRSDRRLGHGLTLLCLSGVLGFFGFCGGPVPPQRARAQSLLAPEPEKSFTIRLPYFEQSNLPNGLTVYSFQDDSLPLTAVALVLRSGSANEPSTKGGLANLAYQLLAERMDAGSDENAPLGSTLKVKVEPDGARLQLNVMAARAERAVMTLAALVQDPKVDEKQLARQKGQYVEARGTALGRPRLLAEEQLRRLIYGPTHPYGHEPSGTPQSVAAITPADLDAYYACSLFPQNAALVLAGRISATSAREWALRHLVAWQAPARACQPQQVPPPAAKRTQIVAVSRPGLVQSQILIGRALVPLGHPDEIALQLAADHVAGRAYYELRRKKGISYGVSSAISQYLYGGHYVLSTAVQADQTGEALSEIFSQLFAVQRDPVNRRFVIYARVLSGWQIMSRYGTLADSVARVSQLFIHKQRISADASFLERLNQVGPDAVDEAGYRYFDRDVMQIVVVGDPEIIRKQVGALKLGALRWLQADGTLGDKP